MYSGSEVIEFNFVGSRRYVRAVDVVRNIEKIIGCQSAEYEFIKPLRSTAVISSEDNGQACVRIALSGEHKMYLIAEGNRCDRVTDRQHKWGEIFIFHFGSFYCAIAPLGMKSIDLIALSVDKIHPTLPRRFVICRVVRIRNKIERRFVLWFKINADQSIAKIAFKSFFQTVTLIECRHVRWKTSLNNALKSQQ